jgi:hypothetical protein
VRASTQPLKGDRAREQGANGAKSSWHSKPAMLPLSAAANANIVAVDGVTLPSRKGTGAPSNSSNTPVVVVSGGESTASTGR